MRRSSRSRRRFPRALGIALATSFLVAAPAGAADRRTESAAKDALKRAANDYLSTDYATGAARLQRAVRACGTVRCTVQTRVALLRDLGTMQFRNGDIGAARKNWAQALKLQPDLELNPDYDTADLHAAWDEVKGGAAAGGGAAGAEGTPASGGAPQPSGDFTHTPAAEQKVNTPLPVYVEYPGSSTVARVMVKYKGASASSWSHVTLKRMGGGWGGVIPCGDVTKGTMRYWIQGFDEGGDPIASSGDPKHPYTVTIRDQLEGEPPHLPNKSPPRACTGGESGNEAENENGEEETTTEEEPEKIAKAEKGAYARFWFGVSGVIPEFAQMPSGNAVCKLTGAALPANPANYYCTNPDGSDFPSRTSSAQNDALTNPAAAGNVSGGIRPGDLRVLATFDYALSPKFLLGARIGGVINAYPGKAAVSDGKAFGSKLDAEARATYLFGDEPLAHTGFAASLFFGAGISEFDVHTTSVVSLNDLAGQYPVRVWVTDGPFFVEVGPGIRYQFSPRAAFTAAARVNAVVGGNGFMLTYGPEFGFLYGF